MNTLLLVLALCCACWAVVCQWRLTQELHANVVLRETVRAYRQLQAHRNTSWQWETGEVPSEPQHAVPLLRRRRDNDRHHITARIARQSVARNRRHG